MSTVTHRAWCNSHVDDEDGGPGLCSRESEPAPTFGVDVTEDDDGLAVDLWHPMRPGQDRRSFTAAELRAIAAELVRAAELVEAEEGMCENEATERPVEAASSIGPPSRQGMAPGEGRAQALTDSASPSTSQHSGGNSHAR